MRDAPCRVCHVCGAEGRVLHEGVRDRLFGVPGQWSFRKCDNAECGLVWLDPKPLESDLHKAYAAYYTHGDADAKPEAGRFRSFPRRAVRALEQLWLSLLLLRSARKQIDAMFLDGVAPGRMLEVGCGEGRLLAAMRSRGWTVEGQDVDTAAVEHARRAHGVNVHLGELHRLALPAASYDAIVMNHAIEHAYDPTALVRECRRLLRDGGLFVATTPNPDSFGHASFGPAWFGLDPPRHLHLLPTTSLARIAHLVGFKEWNVWTTPARAGGTLAASLDIRRSGRHHMRGRITLLQIVSASWYQLTARLAHVRNRALGEEAVLRARK